MNQKGFSLYFILLIVAVLAVIFIVFIQNNKNTSIQTYTPTPTHTPNQIIIAKQEKDANQVKYLLENNLGYSTPSGWISLRCGVALEFEPDSRYPNNSHLQINPKTNYPYACGTEPNNFAINLYFGTPIIFNLDKELSKLSEEKPTEGKVSNFKDNLQFAGKPASQYDQEVFSGEAKGIYKKTVIFYNDNYYLYITLNKLEYIDIYNQILNNIQFK